MKLTLIALILAVVLGTAVAMAPLATGVVSTAQQGDLMALATVEVSDAALEENARRSMEFFEARQKEQQDDMEKQKLLKTHLGITLGVDISTLVTKEKFQCLVRSGYTFAIPRGYRSLGSPDPNVIANLNNAQAAGIKYRDFYIFPCPKCGKTGQAQVVEAYNHVKGKATFGMMWLDIEGANYWLGNYNSNRAFFESMLKGCAAVGANCGIYSSKYMWESIFGSGYTVGGNYPLWWAHYDYVANWNAWAPFGGWTKVRGGFMKQYSDKGSACQVSYDMNFY